MEYHNQHSRNGLSNIQRLCCFEYINRYNSKRPHSSLGDYTPVEYYSLPLTQTKFEELSRDEILKKKIEYLKEDN